MWAIFKKEVAIYFLTPFGYVFGGLFLLISGMVFVFYNLAGGRGDIFGMLGVLNFASIVIFPVLTMKLLSEEKRMATDQLLFTAPVSTGSIVIGKYLAALFVFLCTLAATGVYAFLVIVYSKTPLGAVFGSYLGFAMLGAAYIAICLFASSLTENQVTAAIAGFGFLLSFMLLGVLANAITIPWLKESLAWLAILDKYQEFTSGVLRLEPFVYYLSFVVAFTALTVQTVEQRQQSGGGYKC